METVNYEALHKEFPLQRVTRELDFETKDGLKLHGWQIEAQGGEPRGNVVIIHGAKDYSERYLEFAHSLSKTGYQVFGFDLRGYGRSEGERNYFENLDLVIDDVLLAFKTFKRFNNDKPWIVMGHSMGGNIVSRFVIDHGNEVDAFILSAPLLKRMPELNNFVYGVLKFTSTFFPHLALVDLPNKNFSKDSIVVEEMTYDPLINQGNIPARSGVVILKNLEYIEANRDQIKKPFLVLHGESDLVNNIEGSREFFKETGEIEGKELKLYSGVYHDLLHEPEKRLIEGDIISWLNTLTIRH